MLLQRQYSLWKWTNILIGFCLLWCMIVGLFFQWKVGRVENNIKKTQADIVKQNDNLKTIKWEKEYKRFIMAKFIKENENNTNYYALYAYIKSIKDNIEKLLKKAGFPSSRFKLAVSKQKVTISTVVPSYNSLYNVKWWIFTILEERPFIEKIFVNSYQSKNWLIYFDINLKTK